MMRLRIRAPFAAFRHFTAGSYRPTAPFITPTAAYGLLLNLAGVETRFDDGKSDMTLMRQDLPAMELALGAVQWPEAHSIFQQLHNYPVGASGKERAPDCRGNKYNIQPIRREFLSGIDAVVCVRRAEEIEEQVRSTLRGETAGPRYGLPFLGDNSFLIDSICEEAAGTEAHWLEPATEVTGTSRDGRAARLTVSINRQDMTLTRSALFLLSNGRSTEPPISAWIRVP